MLLWHSGILRTDGHRRHVERVLLHHADCETAEVLQPDGGGTTTAAPLPVLDVLVSTTSSHLQRYIHSLSLLHGMIEM